MASSESWWRSVQIRVRQGTDSLRRTRHATRFPESFVDDVAPEIVGQWKTRSAFDRAHMRNVAIDLADQGHVRDVVLAGLLHDIGKPMHTSTAARTVVVILNRLSPRALGALIRWPIAFPGSDQLRMLAAHAEIGAAFLEARGLPERVTWLVRHHHDEHPDEGLLALQSADDRH